MIPRLALAGTIAAAVIAVAILAGGGSSNASGPDAHAAQAAATPPKPNVVFVLTDDMSSDLLKYMPNVRKLQAEGTSFSRYVVSDSLCCPSRSSIYTGELPHNTGVYTNLPPDGGYQSYTAHGDGARSYGLALQGAGYRTAMLGKYLNGYDPNRDGVAQGWDEWDVAGNGYPEFNYALNENGTVHQYGNTAQDYLTDVLSAKGKAFIDSSADAGRPFAMEIAPFIPHAPSVPAPRDQGKLSYLRQPRVSSFNRANTDAPRWLRAIPALNAAGVKNMDKKFAKRARSLIAVDDMIGSLRAELQAKDVADNTYIVFTSDNGFHLGQHHLRPGKMTAFDSDIRVPLVIAGPGVRRGATVGALAQNTDLAPTFAQLAGLPAPAHADGRSLVPLLTSSSIPAGWRRAAIVEHHGPDALPGDPDRQPAKAGNPTTYTAIRSNDATYVEYKDGEREYYDDLRDPQQRHNTYRSLSASRKASLHAQVVRLKGCHGAQQCATAAG